MTDNLWRGDAPALPQITRITIGNAIPGSTYALSINGKSISVSGSGSVSSIADALAAAWQQSDDKEFQEVTAASAGGTLTLTAGTAGVPFEVDASFPAQIIIETYQTGIASQAQTTTIILPPGTTGGTWALTIVRNGTSRTSSALAWDVAAATLEAELNSTAFPNLTGTTTVTKTGFTYTIRFDITAKLYAAATSVNCDALVGNGTVSVQTIQSPGDDIHEVQAFQFYDVDLGETDTFTISNPGVSGPAGTSTPRNLWDGDVQAAFDQVYGANVVKVTEDGFTHAITGLVYRVFVVRWKSPGAQPVFVLTSTRDDFPPPIRIQAGDGTSKAEVFLFSTSGSADAGTPEVPLTPETFTVTVDGEETGDIVIADQLATIEAEIAGLSTVGGGNFDIPVRVRSGQDSANAFDCWVGVILGNQVRSVSADTSPNAHALTTAQAAAPLQNEIQRLTIEASGGTFGLTYPGTATTTSAIAYGAPAATVQSEIDATLGFGGGDCAVTKYSSRSYDVEFVGDLAATNVDQLVGDPSALTGNATASIGTTGPVVGRNQIETVLIDLSAAGGTFSVGQGVPAAEVDWNASAAAFTAALEATSGIGAGNVSVTGDSPFWTVEYIGDLAETLLPFLKGDASALELDSSAITVDTSQRSQGPYHWDDPRNWVLGHVPTSGERPVFKRGSTGPRYGLRQRAEFSVTVDNPQTAAVETQTTLIDCAADLLVGQVVRLTSTDTLPGGLATETDYYVVSTDRDAGQVELSTTDGGDAVQITDAGAGTHTLAVEIAGLLQWASQTGQIGLPRFNKTGKYWEYRPRELQIGLEPDAIITIGQGPGSGTSLARFDTGPYAAILEVIATAGSAEQDALAIYWTGTNPANALRLFAGSIDLDDLDLVTIEQRGGKITGTDSVRFAAGAVIDQTAGELRMHGATMDDRVLMLRGA